MTTLSHVSPSRRLPIHGRGRGFLQDERGGATVELVVWIPFFLFIFLLIVEASVFYWRYSTMWDTTRDASREISIGAFPNCTPVMKASCEGAVQAYVDGRLGDGFTVDLPVSMTLDQKIEVTSPLSNMTVIGLFNGVVGANTPIIAEVWMRDEPL